MSNPKRGKDSRGNLKRMRAGEKDKRGSKRLARGSRRGDEEFVRGIIGPGWIKSGRSK